MSTSPDTEKQLITLLEQVMENEEKVSYSNFDAERLSERYLSGIANRLKSRPWILRVALWGFRVRLNLAERALAKLRMENDHDLAHKASLAIDKIEKLKFASIFGRMANADDRAWCHWQITLHHISLLDAPFLIWIGTINFKKRRIYFGHWDWIFGYLSGGLVLLGLMTPLIIVALAFLRMPEMPVFCSFLITINVTLITLITQVWFCHTFKAFSVGVQYFAPNKLSYRPLST